MAASEQVVGVYDLGELDTGEPFLVMELLEGEDLGKIVAHGPIAIEQAIEWMVQACDAIGHAHAQGIIHRDIKPSNLFITRRGRLKVLDFGIAKLVDRAPRASASLTRTGTAVGSPSYMAPEQVVGSRDVGARADVWSLGATLYHLVKGRPPFFAESVEATFANILLGDPPSYAGLPGDLVAVIKRALDRDPDARFADANALASSLRGLARSSPLASGRWRYGAVTLAVLVAVTGAFFAARSTHRSSATSAVTTDPGIGSSPPVPSAVAAHLACGTIETCMQLATKLPGRGALGIFDPLCHQRYAPACNRAGAITAGDTGDASELARAVVYFESSCDLQDSDGCFRLGLMYHDGRGVARDAKRAEVLIARACDAGVALACAHLGDDLMDGDHGVPLDPVRAFSLNQKACDLGVVPACTNLGYQLENGSGATRDLERASTLYERSCGPASPHACENECMVYVYGKGRPVDERLALPYCRKACELGEMSACSWTGFLYVKDGGVPVDGKQALGYFEQGCTGGNVKGCFNGARLLQ
jgi:TPR repeat protein